MDAITKKKAREQIWSFISKRSVYHSVFWLLVWFILLAYHSSNASLGVRMGVEFINMIFYAALVYFNLLYLIPNYLTDKKFLLYGALLIVSAIILTPLKLFVFYFIYSGYPQTQADLIDDQFYAFLSSFVFAGSSTIAKIVKDWARQQRERKDMQTQTMQSELRFLKSQINPHFLFNTLNNLYALTLKKSDKAPEIVIKLSEMMRYMLYECNEKRVPLEKEVKYIRNYLELEKLRQGKNVDIKFEVVGNVKDQRIAPLMFIPFLENSFKHGLNNLITHGYVYIYLKVERQKLYFAIENSKAEKLQVPERRRVGGIGLVNVKRRLKLQYPDNHSLKIKDSPNSYAIELQLDLDYA